MRPVVVCGIVTNDVPISYWSIVFFLLPVRVPEIFAEVYSAQFLPVFKLSTSLGYDLLTLSLYHGDKKN